MLRSSILVAICALVAVGVPAIASAAPAIGAPLPRLVLDGEDEGTMQPRGDDVVYTRFDSTRALAGKVTLLSYVAGRKSAEEMGEVLSHYMRARKPPLSHFRPVTVMNLDDSIFGTGVFARSLFEGRAVKETDVLHVLDADGRGLKRWGGVPEGMRVYVLDPRGQILLTERAPLSPAALKRIGEAVDAAIAKMR